MLQRLIPVVIVLGAVLTVAAGAARAQHFDDQDRYGRFEHQRWERGWEREWERDRWERRHGYGRPDLGTGYYAPPPVYYAPPPRPFYARPPIYQAPGFGLIVPFR